MNKVSQSANKLKEKRGAMAKSKIAASESKPGSQELVPVGDDASVVSALSYALSDGGSQVGGSVVGSVKSGVRDSDSEISVLQKKYAGEVEKFVLETCTVIVFVSLDGALTEYPQNKRIMSYSELQREISRIKPKTRKMYIIQDIKGNPISAKHFTGYDLVRVKEICVKPDYRMLKNLPIDWEQTGYHEVAGENKVEEDEFGDDMSFSTRQSVLD